MGLRWLWRTWCSAALLGGMALPAAAAGAEPVRINTSELPPYVSASPEAPGALLEIVNELRRRTGIASTVEFFPWRRALHLSANAPRTAIFPLTRTPEREHQYRWLARLYHENFVFMAPRHSPFDVQHPLRHKNLKIGILRGSALAFTLKELGYTHLVEGNSVDECFRYLKGGIVDAVFGDRAIVRTTLKGHGESEFLISEPLRTPTTWLGGSLDFTDAEIALFQKAMREMVADGSYAQILKKYDLPPSP